jgi:hypothetical protein
MASLHVHLQRVISKRQDRERAHLAAVRQAAQLEATSKTLDAAAAQAARLPPGNPPSTPKGPKP